MGEYNQKKVIALVNRAMGDRTLNAYAKQSSISRTHLKRVITGENEISINIINKITSEEAKPQGNVTSEELMEAAGYINEPIFYISDPQESEDTKELMRENQEEFEKVVQATIFQNVFSNSKPFSVKSGTEVECRFSPNSIITVDKKEYWLLIKPFELIPAKGIPVLTKLELTKLLFAKYDANRIITLLVDTNEAYDSFMDYKDEICYRGNIEVVLIDKTKNKVVKEDILSSVDDKGFDLLFNKN